jgi:hypothetical protein
MYKRQFFQALLLSIQLPFYGSVFLGVIKALEHDAWMGFKTFVFMFLILAPIFMAIHRKVLLSLAKVDRL